MRAWTVCCLILTGMAIAIGMLIYFSPPAAAQTGTADLTAAQCKSAVLACELVNVYSGSNLTYTCQSPSNISVASANRDRIVTAITAITQANPAVLTVTGHGFNANFRPQVTISGVTGTGWAGINAQFVATYVDANDFSVPFNSGALGAPTTTGSFITNAPRNQIAEWAVEKFFYDGSNNLLGGAWVGGSLAFNNKCSDGASSTVQLQ